MKLKNQKTDIKNLKISTIIIFIGAVLACTAPFVHMLFPNEPNISLQEIKTQYKQGKIDKETYLEKRMENSFLGYTNVRKFFYAIGNPLTMLFFSLLIFYASVYINEVQIKKTFYYSGFLCISISFYFVIWALWYRVDFPKELYFAAIAIVSIAATVISTSLIKGRNLFYNNIKLLTHHIVIKGKKHIPNEKKTDYINDYLETFSKMVE